MFYYDYVYFVGNVWTWTNESFRLIKGDTVFDVVNPFPSKGFPIDE